MKPPILGKKTFLPNHPASERFSDELFHKAYDVQDVEENPLYTGRHLLILKEGNKSVLKTIKLLEDKWGFSVANTADFVTETLNESKIKDADALFYNDLGIALLSMDDDTAAILNTYAGYIIEPEKVVYIPDEIPADTTVASTWGIKAIQAHESVYTGAGIKIAVLDTGFAADHPDFKGRDITSYSFVPDETTDDLHGHGTHCIGIACGSVDMNGLRYGVAPRAHIYAGKVLSNQGSGAQAWVLDGMTWAANSGCHVLSMSLGSSVFPGQSYDIAYERAAQFALSKGTVIVAAAGNESRRSKNQFSPVGSPADCPSILAVGAVDSALQVADFSNRAINKEGQVDLAAPGVAIYSSWPLPARYRSLSGTSMATPHVAGILALLSEKYPKATPDMIRQELIGLVSSLPLSAEDVGAGLAIAP